MYRIAVISDTHGTLRPEAIDLLRSADRILHCGDIADQGTLDRLRQLGEVTAVRGNCDGEWAAELPGELLLDLCGRKVYMIHDRKQMSALAEQADIVLFGHSHRYEEKEEDGKLWLNPGSGGPRRFGRPATMAVLEFESESERPTVRKAELSEEAARRTGVDRGSETKERVPGAEEAGSEFTSGRLHGIVSQMVRDLERGKSVDYIVKRRGVSRALAEQICQIYFTHPGIDVQGVLDRIEIAGR